MGPAQVGHEAVVGVGAELVLAGFGAGGGATAAGWTLLGWSVDFSFVVSILFFLLCQFLGLQGYLDCRPVKTNQRLSAAARRSQPAQGLIPIALVARLMTSPRPTSFSVTKPGRRTR